MHDLEQRILRIQMDGIKLYGALAEFYYWLGNNRMSDILSEKFMKLAQRSIDTRMFFVGEYGEMISPSRPAKNSITLPKTYRLQWQEGTEEPGDKSDSADMPWERWTGSSGKAPESEDEKNRMYDLSLDWWLAYEREALNLYSMMSEKSDNSMWGEMADESREEISRLAEI